MEIDLLKQLETENQITIPYLRINQNTPYLGNEYGQDIEPVGEYITYNDGKYKIQDHSFIYGTITFKNPLIVEFINTNSNGWKFTVSKMFNNKKKKALTNAIVKSGYDSIITIDSENGEFKEIVNINGVK